MELALNNRTRAGIRCRHCRPREWLIITRPVILGQVSLILQTVVVPTATFEGFFGGEL
jgi:hypothetical protein